MKMRIWTGACAALTCALTIAATAQAPQNPPAQNPPSQAPATQAPKPSGAAPDAKVTFTGCIERATPAPTGTAGAAGAAGAASDTKFTLTHATRGGASATGTTGAPPSPGAAPSAAANVSYRLDGEDSDLTPHVGHKVEIVGRLDDKGGAPAGGASAAMKINVDSVKMVAATCP